MTADGTYRPSTRVTTAEVEREAVREKALATLAAAGAGEAVDRGALAVTLSRTRAALVRNAFHADGFPPALIPTSVQALRVLVEAGDALLATRGDAAPTVTVEQVEQARQVPHDVIAQGDAHAMLAALGIEVTP